ncbi:hypothetical protein Q4512_01540 [Oceanihabitans sp. 2_MG-2023]|uniref:hypothetical protein n=1 Tax=Oceanihabitans sp. 2_MG-2023 TaxID=3062661 RepID=UPI0026E26490|nr:hypothetical protein [Oceanihabitans sp. 2_MG-2023]MDO6595575.1 hypothetical protein [Oceanihabitans sp. 2_MG-2023]
MLVFPQTFNYRLIIGTLVIAIAILGSYSISSFNSFKNQKEFLAQETKLVQHELTEMISLYNDVSIENEFVKTKLEVSKSKVETILSDIEEKKTNLSLISKYRSQINTLKNEREVIFDQIDSLVRDNKILNLKVDSVSKQFENQKLEIASLFKKNEKLNTIINKTGKLKANNIKVKALTIRYSKVYETHKLSEVDQFEVCVVLDGNTAADKGNKNIYVQILDAKDQIVSERGILNHEGLKIRYSGKTTIKNISEQITACLKISIKNKEKLNPGIYNIDVFQNATLIGSSSIQLI